MRLKYFVVTLSLGISFLIYHFYRVDHILLNQIIANTIHLPSLASTDLPRLPEWVIYSLPETLWVLAATLLSTELSSLSSRASMLILLPLIFSLSLECCQYFHITDGVFDPQDLVAAVVGFLLAMLISRYSLPSTSPKQNTYWLVISSYAILILADVV